MNRLLFLLTIATLFSCTSNESNNENELEALDQTIDHFNEAFKTGDLQVLDSLTTEGYLHTNSSDRAFPKKNWFNYLEKRSAQIASGQLEVTEYELQEKEIKRYNDAAIVTGLIVSSGINNGESFSSQLRVSNFWIKEAGTWKRAGFHDTKIN